MKCSLITLCVDAASSFWRVAGALAAGAAAAATFGVGARDLLALDASADAAYMAMPLARGMYQRAWRYHISSGCALRQICVCSHLKHLHITFTSALGAATLPQASQCAESEG